MAINSKQYSPGRRQERERPDATSPSSPGTPYYAADGGYPAYNPSKAKALVKQVEQRHGQAGGVHAPVDHLGVLDPGRRSTSRASSQAVGMQVTLTQIQQADQINNALAGQFQATSWRQFAAVDPDLNYLWWSPTEIFGTGPVVHRLQLRPQHRPADRDLPPAGPHLHRPGHPGAGVPADRQAPEQGPPLHLERPGHLGHRRQLEGPELQQPDDAVGSQGLRHDRGHDLDLPDLDVDLTATAPRRLGRPVAV